MHIYIRWYLHSARGFSGKRDLITKKSKFHSIKNQSTSPKWKSFHISAFSSFCIPRGHLLSVIATMSTYIILLSCKGMPGIQTSLINILSLWSFVFGILLEQMNNRIILNSSLQVSYVISPLPFHELCKIHSPLINEKARCTGTWILPWISPWASANIHCFILTK